jgi:gamma-glutamyltranspeptidase/glutathione hydrolase
MGPRRRIGFVAALAFLAACAPQLPAAPPPPKAEIVRAAHQMVTAAHPDAARVGREILRQGGSAVDAAIAMQLVLTLVEPQSSGIGGGGFLLHYNKASRAIESYDGRETAPASAATDMFLRQDGRPRPVGDLIPGGMAVGVPGTLRLLEFAHRDHGRLPWRSLFQPAIALAEDGFVVSARLAADRKSVV